jgi:hypothetical protein
MISFVKTLFNNGDNNGSVIIKTKDGKDIKCHDFVLKNTSGYFKEVMESEGFNGTIDLDSNSEIVSIVVEYLYSEKIVDKNLSGYDIIHLYHIVTQFRCNDLILILKNHYLKKFSHLLNSDNWLDLLKIVFNISKYSDLQGEIVDYYKNNVLADSDASNQILLSRSYEDLDHCLKNLLYNILLERHIILHNETINKSIDDKNLESLNKYIKDMSDSEEEILEIDSDNSNQSGKKTKTISKPIKKK